MSDIPVGSPPVPPGRHAAPGGWYVDPVDAGQERYWDGWQWSRNTRPREGAQPTPQRPYGAEPQNPYQNPSQPNPYDQGREGQTSASPNPYGPNPYGPNAYGAPGPGAGAAYGQGKASATADGVPLAGWWLRVLATVIDNIITSAVVAVLGFPFYRSALAAFSAFLETVTEAARTGAPAPPTPATGDLISRSDQALLVAVTVAVGLTYQLVFLRWRSATIGKLVCGLRVVPVDRGRAVGPLGWNAIVVRALVWVLPALSALLAVVQLVDVLFPLFQPKRQALHDLAAKTQVVHLRR